MLCKAFQMTGDEIEHISLFYCYDKKAARLF